MCVYMSMCASIVQATASCQLCIPVWRSEGGFQEYFSSSIVGPGDWTQVAGVGKQVNQLSNASFCEVCSSGWPGNHGAPPGFTS